MDIPRGKEVARRKLITRMALGILALSAIAVVTVGSSRLKPAAPEVELATLWADTVKRGLMVREVRGLGNWWWKTISGFPHSSMDASRR